MRIQWLNPIFGRKIRHSISDWRLTSAIAMRATATTPRMLRHLIRSLTSMTTSSQKNQLLTRTLTKNSNIISWWTGRTTRRRRTPLHPGLATKNSNPHRSERINSKQLQPRRCRSRNRKNLACSLVSQVVRTLTSNSRSRSPNATTWCCVSMMTRTHSPQTSTRWPKRKCSKNLDAVGFQVSSFQAETQKRLRLAAPSKVLLPPRKCWKRISNHRLDWILRL